MDKSNFYTDEIQGNGNWVAAMARDYDVSRKSCTLLNLNPMEHGSGQPANVKLEFIEKKVDTHGVKLDKIIGILSGDQEMDKKDFGLVGEVRSLGDRIFKLERWKDRMIYFAIGISFAAGWGISDLIDFLKHLGDAPK